MPWQLLHGYQGEKKWYRHLSRRAAVAIIINPEHSLGPSLLMIERAKAEGDPWSGQMAFPGGKTDLVDANITQTACRESFEELAIEQNSIKRIARLSDILAKPFLPMQTPMVVSPLLFEQQQVLNPIPCEREVAGFHWLPLGFFADNRNRKAMTIDRFGKPMQLPCYDYQGKRVWGMSLLMIDELIKAVSA